MQLNLTRLAPAPAFLADIRRDVREKAIHSDVVMGHAAGDRGFAWDFWDGLYPFAEQFTDTVASLKVELIEHHIMTKADQDYIVPILNDGRAEEHWHVILWEKAFYAMGGTYADLRRYPVLPMVKQLNQITSDDTNLVTSSLNKVCTEMVAMECGDLMDTPAARAMYETDVEWFSVHHLRGRNVPYYLWHESIFWSLAQWIWELQGKHEHDEPTEQRCRDIIEPLSDVFFLCGVEATQRRLTMAAREVAS